MKIQRFDNHNVINYLRNLGYKIKIRHERTWTASFDSFPHTGIKWTISNRGGKTIVSILTPDGVEFIGEAKNPAYNQYNKNFGVHVALQRAIKSVGIYNKNKQSSLEVLNTEENFSALEEWVDSFRL